MNKLSLFALAAATLLLAGCPKKPTTLPESAANSGTAVPASTAPAPTTGAVASGQDSSTLLPAQPLADPQAELLARSVIYFDLDSDAVRSDFTALVAAHGKRLATSTVRVRLEGHTDERGSDSYNNALGLRRAEGVEQALKLAGAQDVQVDTVSFGEQKPAAGGEGEGEEAWARNRRVEIVYLP